MVAIVMLRKTGKNLLVGLDIGSAKISAVVGEVDGNGGIKIIGVGVSAANGLKRGMVVNVDAAVASIQKAVEKAELIAGCEIHSVYTGIANAQIKSFNSHGVVAIASNEVSEEDIERVIDAAKAVAVPSDQRILHVLPQDFIVDGQDGIQSPVGMSGVRLEVKVHMVISSVSAVQNIVKCIRLCGLGVDNITLQQLASGHATLSDDEQQLGTCLIDIGAGTTSVAVYVNCAVRHTVVIPVAGDHVSNDIAVALRTPIKNAEEIKIKYAKASVDLAQDNDSIMVSGVGDLGSRSIEATKLAEIVIARYEEILYLVSQELQRVNLYHALGSGIVLTGDASLIPGIEQLAGSIFDLPIRIAVPQNITGNSESVKDPSYSTAVGLLMYGYKSSGTSNYRDVVGITNFKGIFSRIKNWVQDNF